MAAALDFYFDFSSPYGYFASTCIDELAARHGREVQWHPILLGAVFKATGSAPLPLIPLKGDYSMHDIERTARFKGIAYRKPSALPIATLGAARATLWVQSTQGNAAAAAFAKRLFKAFFVEDQNISDGAVVIELGRQSGLDADALSEGMQAGAIKEQLRAGTDLAMARGVFGSPYVIVDGEPFWGFDRFDQIEAWLKNGKI